VAYGTYAAAGSDAAGYVSEADLIAHGRLSRDEPLARVVGWPESSLAFETLGYRTGVDTGILVPTYPPGLPALMAAAQLAIGDFGPFLVAPLLGAVAVLCTYLLGVRLHSRIAGAIAAVLLGTSPIFLFNVSQPMSDVPATAMWIASLLLALTPVRGTVILAGLAAGIAVLIRPNLIPLAPAVLLALLLWRPGVRALSIPRRASALLLFAAGVSPAVVALLLVQQRLYGAFVATGHGTLSEFFAVANVLPNIRDYAGRMLVGETPALALLAGASLTLAVARHRRAEDASHRADNDARPSSRGTVLLATLIMATVLVCYLPYGVFAEWYYLRFLLPGLPALFLAAGALTADAVAIVPLAARGLALVVILTAACSVNIVLARGQGAFLVRFTQERSQLTGRYLDSMLSPSALVITGEQSASIYHYTHRPVVRWDLLHTDLDAAISRLQSLGVRPVLVAEAWEVPQIRERFPRSRYARLDWQPRAAIGDHIQVFVYDPADRGTPRAWPADRVH